MLIELTLGPLVSILFFRGIPREGGGIQEGMPYPNPSGLVTGLESMTRQIGTSDELTTYSVLVVIIVGNSPRPLSRSWTWILLYFLWALWWKPDVGHWSGGGRYCFYIDARTSIELPHHFHMLLECVRM